MKVLIVSFCFPPTNVVGAIRVGKLAHYLNCRGYQLRVLTADISGDQSLPLEIPTDQVIRTDYRQRPDWLTPLAQLWHRRRLGARDPGGRPSHVESGASSEGLRNRLRWHYHGLIQIPDSRRDWIKTAVTAGRRLIKEWKPDVIFASAPPITSLIVARRLGRDFDIPWIADFRDLWVDNPYYGWPAWRRQIDAVLERSIIRNAAGLITVSPGWAEQLRLRYGRPAEVVYNGYAKEDFPHPPPPEHRGEVLTIRYTGSIYPGFRDPSAVFAAIALLPDALRNRVIVEFFGDAGEEVLALAAKHCVRDRVVCLPSVPYRDALELQMSADVLLLLQWSHKRDEGNLPAKIFEYLYARRPILFVGYEQGIAAQLVRDRGAGLVSNTPERIRDQLVVWIERKEAGHLNKLNPSVSWGLSRDDQFRKVEEVFSKVLSQRHDGT